MASIRDDKVGSAKPGALAPAAGAVQSAAARPTPIEEDDVLPNLLLDVREGFLAGFRPVFRQFGVTDQQYRVFRILNRQGDMEISKLARQARIAAPSMTGILDRMTEIGWVTRKVSKGQRWGVVGLTASGRRLISELQPLSTLCFASFEAALGAQQLETLRALLLRTRAVVREWLASNPETATPEKLRAPVRRRSGKKQGTRAKPAQRPKSKKTRT